MSETITQKLNEIGFSLGKPILPIANYVQTKTLGSTLYISGQLPIKDGVPIYKGKIGEDLDTQTGIKAAELCMLNILNQLIFAVDDKISRIKSCVKLEVFINCKNNFERHPEIANGASNLLVKVLGDKGKHTRLAVGAPSLPLNSAIEISAIFEIKTELE